MITRGQLERIATLLAGSLSEGRRQRARLDSGPARSFQTDLRTIVVPLPMPAGDTALRTLTCALALQAAPTKEAVARTGWTGLTRGEQRALAWEEGEHAVRWARTAWPGLRDDLDRRFGWVDDRAVELDPAALVRAALESGGREDPPALFGRLPPPRAGEDGVSGRRTFIATRWSSRHKARRSGALPIPVSGPGTEPVLDPGEPGTMEALDGRAGHAVGIPYDEWDGTLGTYRKGHVRVLELDEPPPVGVSPPRLPLPSSRPARRIERGLQDGDVDVDALVAWRVDLAVAADTSAADAASDTSARPDVQNRRNRLAVPPPRLYSALRPARDPLAWALLIDASASSSLKGGNVLRRSVIWADSLAQTLSQRGERVAVFAFCSHGRERVELRALKHFDRPYAALGEDVRSGGYTRLGAALRHAGARVLAEPARAHVLLSLGDALPYDEGYGERYGTLDVAKAVEEIRGRGGLVRHAAMATRDGAALDTMFGPSHWAHTRRAADLLRLVDGVQATVRRG